MKKRWSKFIIAIISIMIIGGMHLNINAAANCDTYDWDLHEECCEYITHTQMKGTLLFMMYEQRPTKVSIAIANKVYSSKVQSDGSFTISYPYQSTGTLLTVVISDDHGCEKTVYLKVESRIYLIDIVP